MMRLHVFGGAYFTGENADRLDGVIRQTKRFAILIYLLCEHSSQPHRRDELMALFWPEADEARARNSLRQSLFALREHLGSDLLIKNGTEELRLDPEAIFCDASLFRQRLRDGALEEALSLYVGPFLHGFILQGCPEFDLWADRCRREMDALALAAAQNLAHTAEGRRDVRSALHWWRRALQLRPFDERMARRIMSILAGSGSRIEAMTEFHGFRNRMLETLGLEPSTETLSLVSDIENGRLHPGKQWIGDRRKDIPGTRDAGITPTATHFRRFSDQPAAW